MKQILRLVAILATASMVLMSIGCEWFNDEYALTVSVSGSGSVNPSGGMYDADTRVTLTATPASGWEFTRWAGDASGTNRTTRVVMDSDKSVTAVFTETGAGDDDDDEGGVLPPVSSVYQDGPFATTVDRNTGSSREGFVFRPTNMGQDGVKHPIYLWGPGGGSEPDDYDEELRRLASHGFVVYSEVSTGTGREMDAAIDWLINQNDRVSSSALYQKLDTTRIAAGGHSMGSITTFAIADDPRLTTTIHVAGGSFDGRGNESLRNPTAYFAGENDNLATSNVIRDYENTDNVPVFFTIIADTDHIYAAQESLPAMISWLRWHLADETWRQEDFIGYNCEFCQGVWDSKSKNW